MITLFGATGYTGQKIAEELARSGLPFRLAGRSASRLEALAAKLAMPNPPPVLVADAQEPATLGKLYHDTRVLINCAGPYTDLGERVLAQAAMSGVHYLDATNELGYRFKMTTYHQMALRSGSAVVPACGFEVALADCAAALAARPLLMEAPDPVLDEVQVVYVLRGSGASAGTRRSAIRSLATSWIAYQDGAWKGAVPGRRVRRFELPAEMGGSQAFYALSFPSCETVTVPAHLPTRAVTTWMSAPPSARYWAPVLVPLFARLARSILGPLAVRLAGGGALRAPQDRRSGDSFTIQAAARRGGRQSCCVLFGTDVYGITAKIIRYYASQMLDNDYAQSGVLAPAQAADPAALLAEAQAQWNVRLRLLSGCTTAG